MKLEEILMLLEEAADSIKFLMPCDITQCAYNEGIEDFVIELENLIKNKIDK